MEWSAYSSFCWPAAGVAGRYSQVACTVWWMTRPSVLSKWGLARVRLYSCHSSSKPHLTPIPAAGVKDTPQDARFRVDQKGSLTSQAAVQDVQQSPGHFEGLEKRLDGATLAPGCPSIRPWRNMLNQSDAAQANS